MKIKVPNKRHDEHPNVLSLVPESLKSALANWQSKKRLMNNCVVGTLLWIALFVMTCLNEKWQLWNGVMG